MSADIALKILTCLDCPYVELREAEHQRFCTPTGNKISKQCELGCPHNLHDAPPKVADALPEAGGFFDTKVAESRAAWRIIHLYASTLPENFDPVEVRRWLTLLPVKLPHGCGCRKNWAQLLEAMPPDLSSRTAMFRWSVRVHNAKNAELGKPQISDARATRIYGVTDLLPPEEIAADASGPIKLLINNGWGLGDAAMMACALWNLYKAYPGEFEVRIRGGWLEFENLPGIIAGVTLPQGYTPDIYCHWKLGNEEKDKHTITWMTERLGAVVNRPIPCKTCVPWLELSDTEKSWSPPIDRPYIVAALGHKLNLTTKAYPHWQRVVSELAGRVPLVRIGSTTPCDVQPAIQGVAVDMLGKTTLRQLLAMIAHPLCIGTLSNDTSLPHIAAGFGKPAVVVAGDRIPPGMVKYEGHRWLRPGLPCEGCMLSRVIPLDPKLPWPEQNGSLCERPQGEFAECMTIIDPAEVVQAVMGMVGGDSPPRWPAVPPS